MNVRMYVCTYVCMYVCMYVRTYVCMYLCMYKAGCYSFELKRLDCAELKRNIRKRTIRGVPGGVNSWECETCGRALLSKAGYVNHVKPHVSSQAHVNHASLPPRPQGHICLMCNIITLKVCKSAPGLKRHMVVHKDLMIRIETAFICKDSAVIMYVFIYLLFKRFGRMGVGD